MITNIQKLSQDSERVSNLFKVPGKNTGVDYHVLDLGELPNPGMETAAPALPADSLPLSPLGSP